MPNPLVYRKLIASGITYEPEAIAFFIAAGISSRTHKYAVNYLVKQLKVSNMWSRFHALYPIVGGNSSAHSVNLISPGTYNITWMNSPTHSSTGVDFDGATQYGKTGLVPSTVLSINNTSLHYYSRDNIAAASQREIGCTDGTVNSMLSMLIRFTGDTFINQQYNNTVGGGRLDSACTDSSGFFSISRLTINSNASYKNGVQLNSNAGSGGTLPPFEIYIGANNGAGSATVFSSKQCALAAIGKGIGSGQAITLYNIVQQYQTLLGRQV